MAAIPKSISSDVHPDAYRRPFSLPTEWYYDPAVYEREVESIFYGSWRPAGHRSEVANPGDFLTIDFCSESLLVIRGHDGELRGFYNFCQHRGHRLVQERRGNIARAVVCPYHAWTYNFDGGLSEAPNCPKVPGFDKGRIRLQLVKVEEYAGLVWANTDLDATSIAELTPGLERTMRACIPDVDEAVFFEDDYTRSPYNWKAMVDNVLDTYHFRHAGPAHRQLADIMRFEEWTRESGDYWIAGNAPPGNADSGAYPLDLSKSRGAVDGLAAVWVWPDTIIGSLPVSRTFYVWSSPPFGPEITGNDYMYYGVPEVRDLALTRSAVDWIFKSVNAEDNVQCAKVHAGHKSRGFKGSHFMIDEDRGYMSEHPGAAFHRLVYQAVSGETPD